jgi:hypothetical protein
MLIIFILFESSIFERMIGRQVNIPTLDKHVIDRAQLWGDDTHNADGIIIL